MKTKDAVSFFGSKIALARAIGVHKSAISQWGDQVPKLRAYQIESVTGGKLRADDSGRTTNAA